MCLIRKKNYLPLYFFLITNQNSLTIIVETIYDLLQLSATTCLLFSNKTYFSFNEKPIILYLTLIVF